MPQYIIYYNQGTAPGPFNIYLSGSTGPLSLYASNVTRTQLESGFIVTFDDNIPSSSVLVDNTAYGCDTDKSIVFPTPTPSKTPSISITPSITPSITLTPSVTITPSRTPSTTPSITPPPSLTPSITPSITPSQTPGASISPTPSISISRTPSITPSQMSFFWMGTTGTYPDSYSAYLERNCSRPYYTPFFVSMIAIGKYIYNDPGLTSPFNGGGRWIAINYQCSTSWVMVQVGVNGLINNLISY